MHVACSFDLEYEFDVHSLDLDFVRSCCEYSSSELPKKKARKQEE
jgi:hypothetical protein